MNISPNESNAPLPAVVQYHHTPEADIITWANKDVINRRLGSIIIFWAVWIGGIGLPILRRAHEHGVQDVRIAILIWIAGIILIPIPLVLVVLRKVTLKISDDAITIIRSGVFLTREKRIPREKVIALAFEPGNVVFDDYESLHVEYKSRWDFLGESQQHLAPWMDEDDEYIFFQFLQEIFKSRGWDIAYKLAL